MTDKGISPIIKTLEKLPDKTEKLNQLINYYKNHQKRMQYHKFKEKGLQIESVTIEAAHKDVLQKQLKLSGQRWTKQGVQQMAQLRITYKSGEANKIKQLCKIAA